MDKENIEDFYPLSPMQQGMLFHTLYAPQADVYFEQMQCRLKGNLDVAAFQHAWQLVVNRHTILRTGFLWERLEQPVQVVYRHADVELIYQDWQELPVDEQTRNFENMLEKDKKRGFQLSQAPLLRLLLARLGQDTHAFVFSYHHLILDGWSLSLLISEVLAFYEAGRAGHELHLEPAPRYRDYIVWLKQQNEAQADEFWRSTLKGFAAPTPLPLARSSRPATSHELPLSANYVLSSHLTDSLVAFVRQQQLTLNTLLQGVWSLLLSCYSGKSDVLFGSTLSSRPAELQHSERMPGLFINTLPVRIKIDGREELLTWLKQLQLQQLELLQYDYSSLVRIQEHSTVPRQFALFESLIVFENYASATLADFGGSLKLSGTRASETTNYPLTLAVVPGTQLELKFIYDTAYYDASTIDQLFEHMQALLEEIIITPQRRVSELSLLTTAERQQLLSYWQKTAVPFAYDRSVPDLVEAQAALRPGALAVVSATTRLTYRELNRRANRVAHYLLAQGIGPEQRVALYMERGANLLIGMLAVLKTGAAYVPLDPAYPQERIAFMLSDAQSQIVLTSRALQSNIEHVLVQALCLDEAFVDALTYEATNPARSLDRENLAYVIYTSGSTGLPKGVEVTHRGLLNLIQWHQRTYEVTQDDRATQLAGIGFDAAVWEIWPYLTAGATLYLPDEETRLDAQKLNTWLVAQGITLSFLPTPLAETILALPRSQRGALRALLTGGDRLHRPAHFPTDFRLVNHYGPTEYSVVVTAGDVREDDDPASLPHIGKPIANTHVYVLDEDMRPVPIGAPGLLYVGGMGLARGYLHRPDLTAERFVPDPFGDDAGVRLYNTGDLVYYDRDGAIQFIGRNDQQVKVRGFRIELGEVEAALRTHPAIQNAVVAIQESVNGSALLLAFVVTNDHAFPSDDEVRRFLATTLPDYMLPARIIKMPEFPLTPNGKVDRQALPMPDDLLSAPQDIVPARTETEQRLVEIWQQVLKVKQIGIYDSFFAAGGHSLLATRLVSRLREAFHLELPLRLIFELTTIASQAEHIDALRQNKETALSLAPLQRVSRDELLPLSFGQQRLWLLYHLEEGNVFYNEFGALRLLGSLDREALERSLNAIVARHEILRTSFVVGPDGQPVQKISLPERLTIPFVDLRSWSPQNREAEMRRLGEASVHSSLALEEGPLFCVQVVQLAEDEHILLLVMHHIIADGWSLGIFLRELGILYTAFRDGKPSPLAALPIQYADYAYWQRQWFSDERIEQQLSYWRKQLAGMPTVLELPTDFTRPSVQTFEGTRFIKVLEPELTAQLKELSLREDVTLFMVLLAAFQVLLHQYTGSEDLVVGTPIAGRTRAETEALIGFFVNTLVLRTNLTGNPDFRTLLKRVRAVALEAYAHQDLSFERLVEELQPERTLSHNPLIQVMFALQNTPTESLQLPGLTVEPVEVSGGTTKYDLTLLLEEEANGKLLVAWEYNTALFTSATVEHMASHFSTLLAAVARAPETRIGAFSVLSQRERQQVLQDWNQTRRDLPELALAQLFEEQVRQHPSATALMQAEEKMSYEQLNCRANQLAWWLRAQGVGPETCVGICFARSFESLIAILAIIKAGGAYVPLDPEYPAERLALMLSDAQVQLVLTDQINAALFDIPAIRLVRLGTLREQLQLLSTANLPVRASQQNLAYIIYTSGSTGRPKGVQICQRSIVRLLFSIEYVRLDARQRILHLAPISFDAATFEIWGALLHGATCVLSPERLLTAAELGEQISTYGVTTMWLTASLYNALVEQDTEALSELQQLLIGGEALSVRHVHTGQQRLFHTQIINGYGPTESTTFACCYPIPRPIPPSWQSIPLGSPIANTQAYVLNEQFEPVGIGIPGELFIGGDGLARGYVGRADLSAERFVPGLVGYGERWYRTGDVVRWLADGTLEYLGRKDEQVKIRGYRIELAEVEEWLRRSPGVREAVASVWEEASGSKRILGYVVAEPGDTVSEHEILAWMREHIPEYLVPWAIQHIEHIPVTTNGKVDRSRLPRIERQQEQQEDTRIARTPQEQVLMEIWQQILRVEQIGLRENFFEQGGDSILSIQMAAQARERGWELTARQVFQHQTIESLASVLRPSRGEQQEQEDTDTWVGLTPIQHWFMRLHIPQRSHWNQALLVKLPGETNASALSEAFEAVVRHHPALIQRFAYTGDGWQQRPGQAATTRMIQIDVSMLKGAAREQMIERRASELQTSMSIELGDLFHAALFHLGEQEQHLLLIAHHLVTDGVSWRIILQDLRLAYEQIVQGKPVLLLRERTSYRQWVRWLMDDAQAEQRKGELAYWQEQTAAGAHLPLDETEGENSEATVQTVSVALSVEETRQLLRQVPGVYKLQVSEVLVTALVKTLTAWTGNEIVRIALEGHGREEAHEEIDLSRTAGWFTTLYPLRLTLRQEANPAEALKKIKEQLRCVPGKGVGYGLLRELTREQRVREALSQQEEPEISFNYLGQFDQLFDADMAWKPVSGAVGLLHDPMGLRPYLLDVVANVVDDQLRVQWHYSQKRHHQTTIAKVAQAYIHALQGLIKHCLSPEAGGYTPVDFPLTSLDQASLDHIHRSIQRIEDIYPLAPLQHGLLFHNLYEPTSGTYFVQAHCALQGLLDISAFERAWQTIVQRYAILRTAFVWEQVSMPVQVVASQVEISLLQYDWQGYNAAELQEKLQDFLLADRQQGFDVRQAPLMRLMLCKVNEDTYHFIWSHHHLLLDGWSLPIIFKDLFALYKAYSSQRQPQLPVCPPYRDYIAWLQVQDESKAERFWRQMLQGFSEPTRLSIELAGKTTDTTVARFAEQQLTLSHDFTQRLQLFARQQQITINTLFQGAWALLLSLYSGQQDVVFGTTVSGRPTTVPGVEAMVGLFINTLPVRIQLPTTLSCQSWLQQIQQQQAEQRLYEYTPLVRIQNWSEIPQEAALFDYLFVFENYPVDVTAREAGLSFSITEMTALERISYPLTMVIIPGTELGMKAMYDGNRFADQDIERLLRHFSALLEHMLVAPQQLLAHLSPLSVSDYEQAVYTWNQTQTTYPHEACIPDLFEEQVQRTPNAVAIICGEEAISYADLNGRANRLAHYLLGLGVSTETPVGLCIERSVEQLVAILAILKAGGAYIPLDAGYPEERLNLILQDAGWPLVVTEEAQQERLAPTKAPCVFLEQIAETLQGLPETNLQRHVHAENLLYIMYTSGSTGVPKGVCITHRAVTRLVRDTDYVQLTAEDRIVQAANVAFDASTFELWGAWLNGACVVMLMKEEVLSLPLFARILREQRVSTLFLTTALFNQLAREIPQVFASLKHLLFGGEAVDVQWVRQVLDQGAPQRLLHVYGPTESTTFASWHQVEQVEQDQVTIPIGMPLANTEIYVLNAHLQPVPVEVVGELYIGGDGLARGYLKQPELTAEKFIPHPWSRKAGARLYKTGDLVKRQADGAIVFVGRVDHQVKIRGHRIELEEIMQVLEQYSAVQEALVVVREAAGSKQLVGYVIAKDEIHLEGGELRKYMQQRLPDYMVPTHYIQLAAFPLTSNGKIDRRALPVPDDASLAREQEFTASHTALEQRLVQIWASVLQVEQIGIHDNFFALGGDSILSIQISARARQAGIALTPKLLFQQQTIAELAVALGQEGSPPEHVAPGKIDGGLMNLAPPEAAPLTPIQRWFFEQTLPNPHHWNQAMLLSLPDELERETLQIALHALLKQHEALSLRFEEQDGEWRQTRGKEQEEEILAYFDLRHLEEAQQNNEMERLATRLQTTLHITHGPLLRAGLFELGTRGQRLLLVIHHLVVDGISWRILVEDLQQACTQIKQETAVQLLPEITSYRQWASRLTQYSQEEALAVDYDYWLSQASQEDPALPLDYPEGENTMAALATVTAQLGYDDSQALLLEVPGAYRVQVQEVLLTALVQTLSEWANAPILRIDLEGHGREEIVPVCDLSRTIGWFTCIYPLTVDIREAHTPGELLNAVKKQWSAVPRKGLSYGLLRYLQENIALRDRIADQPAAAVSFNYLGQFDQLFDRETGWLPARETVGQAADGSGQRAHLLDVAINVMGGQFQLQLAYSSQLHTEATIERLAQDYLSTLRKLISYCLEPEANQELASRFPHAKMNQKQLDKFIAKMTKSER